MIMSMYESICVTNRHLVTGDFLEQIRRVAEAGCTGIILREKDLSEVQYEELAKKVMKTLEHEDIPLILHTYVKVAVRLGVDKIHLPAAVFFSMEEEIKQTFQTIGVSVHSAEEADAACKKGASFLMAGHIFATDCKKGVPPRGLSFLREICRVSSVPVYAIGGVNRSNAPVCIAAGAAGVCMMSAYMTDRGKHFDGEGGI